MSSLSTDYLVVGAGAMGMAFTDALIDHADVHVTLVDRRFAAGGHWQDAYPFVQLHQASQFYGVASTVLGGGSMQTVGPETGLHERARRAEIQSYYDTVLHDRFVGSGRVTFLGGSDYRGDGGVHLVTSRVSNETVQVAVRRRVVDATYLSPTIPATTPPPFGVADGARVVAVNQLATLVEAPQRYVIVGSGKTATDGIIWLLRNGVDPARITWVRPREPWMLNRAAVQPDPVVGLELTANTMAAAAGAESLDDLFLRLEAAGVMQRIDPDLTPTMAKAPTLGRWELDLLRTVEDVVRLGHIEHVTAHELVMERGVVPLSPGSLVVHCAAVGTSPTTAGPAVGARPDPAADDQGRVSLLLRCAGRLCRGHPRRRPGTQPAVSAQLLLRRPRRLGADAGPWRDGVPRLQRRARHRHLGQPVRAEPGEDRAGPARPAGGAASGGEGGCRQ